MNLNNKPNLNSKQKKYRLEKKKWKEETMKELLIYNNNSNLEARKMRKSEFKKNKKSWKLDNVKSKYFKIKEKNLKIKSNKLNIKESSLNIVEKYKETFNNNKL